MRIISTYAGHESNISLYVDGKITIIELDKLFGEKYLALGKMSAVEQSEILELALETAGVDNNFDLWINGSYHQRRNGVLEYKKLANIINHKRSIYGPGHHLCHAHSAYWQSPFDKAWLVSSDGGGNDGYFNIYHCNRKTGPTQEEQIDRFDFGTIYALVSGLIPQVGKTSKWLFDLAGKSMALAAQLDTKTPEELTNTVRGVYSGEGRGWKQLQEYIGLNDIAKMNQNNIQSSKGDKKIMYFDDQRLGMKLAKANQEILQEKFINIIGDRQYNVGQCDDNIILTGGVALNVVNNESIKNHFKHNMFVPPNPTDGGLSLGALFWYLHLIGIDIPQQDWKFSGTPLIENKKFKKKRKTSIKTIAKMIKEGAILGIVEGDSEVGPRALGRRSIICNPSIREMKDTLNDSVKHREWYRPFAPIVLEEHLHYLDTHSTDNLEHMSYAVKTTLEFERNFPAVCHVDGTARVQVCDDKNSTVYKLLKEIGTPLLNTSFNVNGKPIISSTEDAYSMLPSLDGIVVNGVLIKE